MFNKKSKLSCILSLISLSVFLFGIYNGEVKQTNAIATGTTIIRVYINDGTAPSDNSELLIFRDDLPVRATETVFGDTMEGRSFKFEARKNDNFPSLTFDHWKIVLNNEVVEESNENAIISFSTPDGSEDYFYILYAYTREIVSETKISLNKQGGNGGDNEVKVSTGQPIPNIVIPTKSNHTFLGYFDSISRGTKYINENGTSAVAKWDIGSSEYTLYAHWAKLVMNITYKDKGETIFSGTHDTGYPTIHTYGIATELKSASKQGYTFGGWYLESDCSGIRVYSLGAKEYLDDITLYAKWIGNVYNIYYYDEGGSLYSGNNSDDLIAQYTNGIVTTLIDGKKDGYSFLGWYDNPNCLGSQITELGNNGYGNLNLYAKFYQTESRKNITLSVEYATSTYLHFVSCGLKLYNIEVDSTLGYSNVDELIKSGGLNDFDCLAPITYNSEYNYIELNMKTDNTTASIALPWYIVSANCVFDCIDNNGAKAKMEEESYYVQRDTMFTHYRFLIQIMAIPVLRIWVQGSTNYVCPEVCHIEILTNPSYSGKPTINATNIDAQIAEGIILKRAKIILRANTLKGISFISWDGDNFGDYSKTSKITNAYVGGNGKYIANNNVGYTNEGYSSRFSYMFTSIIGEQTCKENGCTDTTLLKTNWNLLKTEYNELNNSSKGYLSGETESLENEDLQAFASLYDYVYHKYGGTLELDNFAGRDITTVTTSESFVVSLTDVTDGNKSPFIIIIITLISCSIALISYLLLKNRKED